MIGRRVAGYMLVTIIAGCSWGLVTEAAAMHPLKSGLRPVLASTRWLDRKDDPHVGELMNVLDGGCLEAIPEMWFGDSYDPSFADLIFYVPPEGDPVVRLVHNGEAKQRLFGARYVWAVAFVKKAASKKEAASKPVERKDDSTATFRLEPLDYRRGLGDHAVIKGLGALVGVTTLAEPGDLEDKSDTVKLLSVGTSGGNELYYAITKFKLRANSIDRVRLSFANSRTYATFGNYDDSKFGLSFALVVSLPARSAAKARDFDLQPYLPIHRFFNLPERPRLPSQEDLRPPQRRVVHSVFVAPTISKTPLESWMVGYGAWDLFGSTGLVLGPEFRRETRPDSSKVWVTRWSIGLSIAFQ